MQLLCGEGPWVANAQELPLVTSCNTEQDPPVLLICGDT